MSRADWMAEREERRSFAMTQGSAPTQEVFRSWSFFQRPEMLAAAMHALSAAAPDPDGEAMSLALAPTPQGPPLAATRRTHETSLADLPPVEDTPDHRAAWCIAELDRLGREIGDRERKSWNVSWTEHPEHDTGTAAIWAALVSGNPWGLRDRCETLWLGPAERSFAAVLAARELPRGVALRAQEDLREAFFYRLLGDGTSTPGWAELAVRVLETVGPVIGPASTLGARSRGRVGGCVVSRTSWSKTISGVFGAHPDKAGRALAIQELSRAPHDLEALLDLHVALRFLELQPSDRAAAWRLVTQNRGKARGRLRAVVAEDRSWLPALLALDALHARTQVAVSRYAWSWAWQELSFDFSFDPGRAITPPCAEIPPGLEPLDDDARSPLLTWVLLVALKGRLPHLHRWVATGGTGDRDSTWARLLQDVPGRLLDPDGGYRRIRIHFHDRIAGYQRPHEAVLRALTKLPVDRRLKARVLTWIEPGWSAEIPMPKSGFPTFIEHARAALPLLEENPCP